jgi:hypothetical protein
MFLYVYNVIDYDSNEDKDVDLSNYNVNRRSSGQFSAFTNQTPGPSVTDMSNYNEELTC